jgi:DNA-binding NtrC family response regulator
MILIVSADLEARLALYEAISAMGVVALAAQNVREALWHVKDAAAVVLDLLTPGIDGEAFRASGVPVFVVGAHGLRPILIVDRIPMPFTLGRLIDAVAGVEFRQRAPRETNNVDVANAA